MKRAYFRFYAELNDFLPDEKQGQVVVHLFKGNPSVKDRIEAIGIPHTEVNLIIKNGKKVDFSYTVQASDRLGVYPVFRSLPVRQIDESINGVNDREPRFVLDIHLGKLAKYLRMLGFDTLYRNDYRDKRLAEISAEQQRILLTRDHGLLKRKIVSSGCFIRHDSPRRQLIQVFRRYNLFNRISSPGRCIHCNSRLEPVAKEKIIDRLEPKTKKYYQEFCICPGCDQIYWQGSHYQQMMEYIRENLPEEVS